MTPLLQEVDVLHWKVKNWKKQQAHSPGTPRTPTTQLEPTRTSTWSSPRIIQKIKDMAKSIPPTWQIVNYDIHNSCISRRQGNSLL